MRVGPKRGYLDNSSPAYYKNFGVKITCAHDWNRYFKDSLSPFNEFYGPADHLLLIKEGSEYKVHILGVSSNHFSQYLNEEKPEDIWMMTPTGIKIAGSEKMPSLQEESIQLLLVQINAFNGNIQYLVDHPKETQVWLGEEKEQFLLRVRMMSLRSNVSGRKLLKTNDLFKYSLVSSKKLEIPPPLVTTETSPQTPAVLTQGASGISLPSFSAGGPSLINATEAKDPPPVASVSTEVPFQTPSIVPNSDSAVQSAVSKKAHTPIGLWVFILIGSIGIVFVSIFGAGVAFNIVGYVPLGFAPASYVFMGIGGGGALFVLMTLVALSIYNCQKKVKN